MPIKIILWTLLFYLVYCGFLFLMQRQILFPRYLIDIPSKSEDLPFMEKIWIKTSFGKTEAWFLPPGPLKKTEPSPAVIFAHGNGELIDFWPDELKRFNHFGIGVMLLEYPGYGRSEGRPSQKSITETFNNAYNILIERKDVDPAKIILFGRSIGGGAVCTLAAERPSAALILMSTFTSARSFTKKYFVPGFLVRDPFNNLVVVRNYPKPVLVFHGKFDEVIPYSHGMALYKSAPHSKMITYESGHNDCPPDWETFWRDLEAFLHASGIINKIGSSPD
ncbi:MAG: alpha/beta hydrolase [Desulfobacteraceae bacterium]|nr:alpha/beta hydrolase [Desulfobacteraceae bacterium]